MLPHINNEFMQEIRDDVALIASMAVRIAVKSDNVKSTSPEHAVEWAVKIWEASVLAVCVRKREEALRK